MGDVAALQTFLARSELMQGDSKGNTGTFTSFYELLSIKKDHSIGYPALVHAAGYGKIEAFCLLLSATPLWPMEQLRRSLTQASRQRAQYIKNVVGGRKVGLLVQSQFEW